MSCFGCQTSSSFRAISRAMAKATGARLRRLGIGKTDSNWTHRAEVCERCPMRVVYGATSYCGKPFLQQIERDQATEGCGCPTRDKAKDPTEHCPIDSRNRPAVKLRGVCSCKWCQASASRPQAY